MILPEAKQDLTWWIQSAQWVEDSPTDTRLVIMTSDVSLQGWGAACKETQTGGSWLIEERQSHINLPKLKAALPHAGSSPLIL